MAAIEIVPQEPQRHASLLKLMKSLRTQLVAQELIEVRTLSQIIPVFTRTPDRTVAAAAELRQRGFFVPAIRPPSVPEGQSLLRISLTCMHTEEQISALVAALAEVAR